MSATIHITADPKVKAQAQKIAKEMGLNLSTVINHLLKQFIDTKEVVFTVERTIPPELETKWTKDLEASKDEPSFNNVDDLMTSLLND